MEAAPPVRSSLFGVLLQVGRLSVLVSGGQRTRGWQPPTLPFPVTSELLVASPTCPNQRTQVTACFWE
jgi:hypothetical protein